MGPPNNANRRLSRGAGQIMARHRASTPIQSRIAPPRFCAEIGLAPVFRKYGLALDRTAASVPSANSGDPVHRHCHPSASQVTPDHGECMEALRGAPLLLVRGWNQWQLHQSAAPLIQRVLRLHFHSGLVTLSYLSRIQIVVKSRSNF